jgi:DNA invertase Pin-like site-specific DNA recombinase/peptidoglycan hydrolase-like protein with peptidoglycan-binding domain
MFSTYGSGIRRAGLVAVVAAVVLLWVPATGLAAGASGTRPALVSVAQAGVAPVARWAGYWSPVAGTRAAGLEKRRVRVIQRVLTRLGKRPGPVDGLFGPLTEAGVVRFQRSVGIAADGIVGQQTARRMLAAVTRLPDTRLARNQRPVQDTGRFASARLPRGGTAVAGLGASVSQVAAPGQEEEVEPALMLALALPLLLVSALLGALRGRVTPARQTNGKGTMNNSVMIPAAPRRATTVTAGHSGHKAPAKPEQPARPQQQVLRAIGYVTGGPQGELEESGVRDQMAAIAATCVQRGWDLLEIVRDVEREGVRAPERPGLVHALKRLEAGEAGCLVIYSLPRLSPAVTELGSILKQIGRGGGRFVSLEDQIDTAEPAGRKAANVIVSVSGWERERLGERTREGLAAARAKGSSISRPSVQDVPMLKERVAEMRAEGMTLQAIADWLNDAGVPTLRGGQKWRPSSVQAAAGYRRPKR